MIALQILVLWIGAAVLIFTVWGAIGVQWTRRANDMREFSLGDKT